MTSVLGRVRRRVPSGALAALVALIAVLSSLLAASTLAIRQREAARAEVQGRTAAVADAVATEARRYENTLRMVAASAGAFDPLSASKFAQTVAPLAGMRLAGATSIAYMVAATDSQVPQVQALWRTRGVPQLQLNPVGTRAEHIFSVFSIPLDGATKPRLGIDASQAPAPAQALNEARRSGQVSISAAYQLIIDQSLPEAQRQMSFTLTAPVYGPADAEGHRQFRGWVLMGVRGRDFISATLTRMSQGLIDVSLHTDDMSGRDTVVATLDAPVKGRRDLSRTVAVPVADRSWQLEVSAAGAKLPSAATGVPTVVATAGLVLGLLLGALVWVLATGRARARAQVRAATAELATAEAEARRQAELLAAILDGISDGVGVVDQHGQFLLHNPAAKAILGLEADQGGTENWQQHYGLFKPDGTRPFPTEQLPLARALAGESVDQVEMLVRNLARPDGVTITVSARPLARAGHAGAVAVFHDVTERKNTEKQLAATIAELREREADLRAFAGVVAHDLKAPLTAVAGYTEIMEEHLEAASSPVALRPALQRVHSGVDRMRRLIDDLLTYATARDGTIAPVPVDLQALTAEVIAERTAHLRNPADGQNALFPDIYTGPLPTVHADPVLLRQLLDNLIGNALKYTLPGQRARIDISAHAEKPGWIRVQIADRGVGIPAADHERVFETFHRSAAHTSRYTGTGLGLAICKKIVERHQGSIRAGDNPGGGTRMLFTLPLGAATVDAPGAAVHPPRQPVRRP